MSLAELSPLSRRLTAISDVIACDAIQSRLKVRSIAVSRQGAGKGELTVEVTDPTGSPVPIDTLRSPSGDDRISFLPTKLGEHKINVKMSGFQVQG